MCRFPIAHYRKEPSSLFINGGELTVTDSEYVVTCFLKTVARFPISQTTVSKAPALQLYEGITLTFRNERLHLYVWSKDASPLYECIPLSAEN